MVGGKERTQSQNISTAQLARKVKAGQITLQQAHKMLAESGDDFYKAMAEVDSDVKGTDAGK